MSKKQIILKWTTFELPTGKYPHHKGEHSTRWKGGLTMHHGYVRVYCPDHPYVTKAGYVFEHRLILEKKLGRYLYPDEETHHINGIKSDNRPENLECVSRTEHRKIEGIGHHRHTKESKKKISIANSGHNNGMYKKVVLRKRDFERIAS